MIRLEIWNKRQGFTLPNGVELTKEGVFEEYPITKTQTIVLEYLPNGFVGAIDDMAILRDMYKIDSTLSDEDALTQLIEIRNAPPQPYTDPIEAKLDYMIMMTDGGL